MGEIFGKNKIKFKIKPEVMELFYILAEYLQLYDKRFPENDQCGGFIGFKNLCFNTKNLPKNITQYESNEDLPGFYYIKTLHPLIRQSALNLAKAFQQSKEGTVIERLKEIKEKLKLKY